MASPILLPRNPDPTPVRSIRCRGDDPECPHPLGECPAPKRTTREVIHWIEDTTATHDAHGRYWRRRR